MARRRIDRSKWVHPHDVKRWKVVARVAKKYAKRHQIRLAEVLPSRPGSSAAGYAFYFRGVISIKIRQRSYGQWETHPFPWTYVMDTVAHELAHLAAIQKDGARGHGERFHRWHARIWSSMLDDKLPPDPEFVGPPKPKYIEEELSCAA